MNTIIRRSIHFNGVSRLHGLSKHHVLLSHRSFCLTSSDISSKSKSQDKKRIPTDLELHNSHQSKQQPSLFDTFFGYPLKRQLAHPLLERYDFNIREFIEGSAHAAQYVFDTVHTKRFESFVNGNITNCEEADFLKSVCSPQAFDALCTLTTLDNPIDSVAVRIFRNVESLGEKLVGKEAATTFISKVESREAVLHDIASVNVDVVVDSEDSGTSSPRGEIPADTNEDALGTESKFHVHETINTESDNTAGKVVMESTTNMSSRTTDVDDSVTEVKNSSQDDSASVASASITDTDGSVTEVKNSSPDDSASVASASITDTDGSVTEVKNASQYDSAPVASASTEDVSKSRSTERVIVSVWTSFGINTFGNHSLYSKEDDMALSTTQQVWRNMCMIKYQACLSDGDDMEWKIVEVDLDP